MKIHVPRLPVLFALLFLFAAEHLTFLPLAHAQGAQAGAAVPVGPRAAAGRQFLRGHVPAAVARLQPLGHLAPTNRLNLAIGLPLRNQQALTQLLQQISDPAHPNYRHYLTPGEFAARFGPTEQDYQAVIAFAKANGLAIRSTHPNRILLDVNGSVPDIEKALHVTMHLYQHPMEARTFYAPEAEPALDLAVPLLGISGLNNYALPRPRVHATRLDQRPNAAPNSGSGPIGTYMGGDFRAAYLPGVALIGAGQVVGLLQFDGYTPSDIAYYERQTGLPNVPLTNVLLDGFTGNPTGSGGEVEVSLDIEMAISMAPGLAGVMVYMAGPYGNWHDILNQMATDNLAKQLSCSWYSPGGGPDPVADQIFQQMAVQGQSFFNASGDADAFTGPVDFPGETPYMVQVGGTTLTTSGPGGAWVSETVWNWGGGSGSGGGISTRYVIPSYQADINMTLNQGSTTMRNIPDVALTADNVYVRANARDYSVGGTSCAAPLWAGFTALVNQQAVAGGRPVVGGVNPAVDAIGHDASYTACFHDITTGNNTGPGSPTKFYAVAGYDLCTGWGTPAGQKLINALATPDPLLIYPLALAFSGGVGGPFSPNPGWLTLTNSGTNALSWTLVNTSAWFNVSPIGGTLLPGGAAASVSVSVNASANSFVPGVYPAVLALTNQSSGAAQSCSLALSVAAPNMADEFDSGIDLTQWSSFGGVVGSTVLATNYGGSVSAPNSLWFGNAGSRFATTVPINTSGGGQIGFCIRLANGTAWPWAVVGNLPADGVVLECSTNGGGSWTAIGNYDTPAYYNWTGVTLPIPVVAQSPAALFRWRQLSNSGTNYEHWALDNVVIGTGSMAPEIVMDPQSQNAAVGQTASLSVAAVGTPPLSYQWFLNGTNIDGAIASSLVWTNIQLTDAGMYSVLVSNNLGTVMSSNAVLTTYVPVCDPPPPGMVSWWAAEGDASDALGANSGVQENGAGFSSGRVGLAFSFNASSNSYVQVADSPSLALTTALTWECWAKRLNTSQVHTLVEKGGSWTGGQTDFESSLNDTYSGGAHLGFSFAGGWRGCAVTPDTAWHHYAAVAVNGQANPILYVDGVPQPIVFSGGPATMSFYPSTRALHIGALIDPQTGWSFYSDTLIDELTIYNRALSASEIQAIYNAGSGGKCSGGMAPTIVVQPASQTVVAGSSETFAVTAGGTPPLGYQWLFGGTNVAGATGTSLTLSNAQPAQAGNYAVLVTNAFGSITSSNAVLTINLPPPCATPPAGLVSWWQGEGNSVDPVGGNSGTLVGGVGFAPGKVGKAFSFNGSAYVAVPSSASLNFTNHTPMSVEMWVYRTGSATTMHLLGMRSGCGAGGIQYQLSFDPSNGLVFIGDYSGPWVITHQTLAMNVWEHLAVTYNGTEFIFYINGNPVTTVAGYLGAANGQAFKIGDSGGCASFVGLMDEISMYNRELTAGEVQAIYNAGSGGKCTLPPVVNIPPQSQTAELSHDVTFSVTATGLSPLSYQWYFGNAPRSSATNATLLLTNVGFAQAGNYSIVITNAYGSATGGPAVLTVVDTIPPTIISCASNRTLSAGANCRATLPDLTGEVVAWDASGSVIVTQNPPSGTKLGLGLTNVAFTVQDSSGNTSFCACSVMAADTTPPFVMACVLEVTLGFDTNCQALLPDLTGTNYLIASDNCSSVSVVQAPPAQTALPAGTNVVVLTISDSASNQTTRAVNVIIASPPQISVQPTNLSAVLSSNAAFNVTACGSTPLSYQWQRAGTNIFFGTNAVLTLNAITMDDAGDYQVLITNSAGSITSTVATLTVLQPPVITWQPWNVVAAPGATVSFWVEAEGLEPMTYVWQKNGTPIADCTDAWLTITNVQPADFAGYTVGITNRDGGVLSELATLRLAASPRISSLSFNLTTFSLAVPTEVGPTYVVEYKDTLANPTWHVLTTLAGTGSSIPISDNGLTNATRFYRVRVR